MRWLEKGRLKSLLHAARCQPSSFALATLHRQSPPAAGAKSLIPHTNLLSSKSLPPAANQLLFRLLLCRFSRTSSLVMVIAHQVSPPAVANNGHRKRRLMGLAGSPILPR